MTSAATVPTGFIFQKELGRGGTALVVLAHRRASNREVALKLPLLDLENSRESFGLLAQREWRLMGGLRYPGLVRVLEVSVDDPAYVALEVCHGPTLDLCGRIESLLVALNIINAMAISLEFLRLKEIIHGDFKPHNVFLPSRWQQVMATGEGYVKLSDFSMGRVAHEADRAGLGTVGCMAPEMILDGRTSYQSDLFALGVTAYQLLSGEHPFIMGSNDPVEINSRCCEEEPTPIEKLRPDLPAKVTALINRLLAKEAADRSSSGWEVCCSLDEAGATYPFQRKLGAAHLIAGEANYEGAIGRFLELNNRQRERLDSLTTGTLTDLRLILADNQRRGNLRYNGQRFEFRRGVLWPAWMRRRSLQKFSDSSMACQRQLVKAAVIGSVQDGRALEPSGWDKLQPSDEPTVQILRPLLSPATVRDLSRKFGPEAQSKEQYVLAARLYTQAGDLDKAELFAFQAAAMLHDNHQSAEALILLKQVVAFADLCNRTYDVRRLLMIQGDILKDTGETEDALAVYENIVKLYEGRPPGKLLGEAYRDIGDLYKTLQKVEEGLTALGKALEIYRTLNDDLEVSRTLNNMGNMYWIEHDLNSALDKYRAALRLQRRLRAETEIASTLSNIGSIYAIQGRLERAINIMRLALQLKKILGNAGEIARSLNNLGYCYHVSGQSMRAVDCLTESLELNRTIGSQKEILFNLENLTSVMITAGQLKESLSYLSEGLSLATELGDKPHRATFNISMATVLRRMGRLGEAATSLLAVEEIIEGIDSEVLTIQLSISRAGLRAAVGDTDGAVTFAGQGLELADKAGAKPEQLNALLVLVRVAADDRWVDDALNLADELSLEREKTLVMFGRLGRLLAAEKETAVDDLIRVLLPRLESITDDIELAGMLNTLAEFYIRKNARAEAQKVLDRALRVANVSHLLFEKIRTLIMVGNLRQSQNEFELCFAGLKQALGLCRQVADGLTNEDDRRIYLDQPLIKNLVSEVTKLTQRLGQRERM